LYKRKGEGYKERMNKWKYNVLMYKNGKMKPVETIPVMGERG
jgi:hypothetical protein